MHGRYHDNWSYKWSKFGTDMSNYTAMFSCPQVGTNILYKYHEIQDMVEKETHSAIPRQVLLDALYSCAESKVVPVKRVA